MATINRTSIVNNASSELGVQQAVNNTPKQASDNISLVYPINQKYTDVMRSTSRSATGPATVYTTPTDKDFYFTYAQFSYQCNNACDATEISLSAVIGGTRTVIRFIRQGAGVADKDALISNFTFPIKLDRGTAITHQSIFAAGTMTFTTSIGGFILE